MIVAAILLTLSAPQAAAATESEIVVIAKRQKDWRGKWGMRKGRFECRTIKSTGDKEIDAIGCSAITACMAPAVPRFQAIADSKEPKADRDRRITALAQSLVPCLENRRTADIAALADRRAGS